MNSSPVDFPSHCLGFYTDTSTPWSPCNPSDEPWLQSYQTFTHCTTPPQLLTRQKYTYGFGTLLNKHWRSRIDLMQITNCFDFTFSASFTFLASSFPITEILPITWRISRLPFLYYLVCIFPLSVISFSFQTLYITKNDLELLTSSLLNLQCWYSRYWSPWPMQCWDLNQRSYTN